MPTATYVKAGDQVDYTPRSAVRAFAGNDTAFVIDTQTDKVVETISMRPDRENYWAARRTP